MANRYYENDTKKIFYIHGLSSSGSSNTVKVLRELLPKVSIIAPDLPIDPYEALSLLRDISEKEQPHVVIGTSMGGMFAQQLHGYKKILVNPSFHVSSFMRKNIGIQSFLNPRKDAIMTYAITEKLCNNYADLESKQFTSITPFDVENTYALFGTNDDLVNCSEEYLSHYKHHIHFEGGHRLSFLNIEQIILPLLEQLWEYK